MVVCAALRAAPLVQQTILGDVQIEVGHGHDTEVVHRMVDLVEVGTGVACAGVDDQVVQSGQCSAVDLLQLVICHTIGVGIKSRPGCPG